MRDRTSIQKRDYQDWLRFCEQVQNTTDVPFNEPEAKKKERIKRALKDYNFFVQTYFPIYASSDCAYFHLDAANAIIKDPNCMAVLEWPREHAKSVHANVLIPMWLIAHNELTGMILMGKNGDDACNLLSDIQAQLQFNQLFAHDYGEQYNMGSWEEGDFNTRSGIRFLALGRDQSPRGARKNEKRPNYAVVDDVDDDEIVHNQKRVKNIVERILGALFFALSIKGARLVIAGNRIHAQSVLAHLVGDIKPGAPKRKGIYHSKVYATEVRKGAKAYIEDGGKPAWKERYSLEELKRKIQKAGVLLSRREFYHENVVEGDIFKDDYMHFRKLPKPQDYTILIGYFDPSFENKPTSDYKAIRVWGLYKDEFHCRKSFVRKTELVSAFLWMAVYQSGMPKGVGILWYVEKQFFNRPVRDAIVEAERISGVRLHVITDQRDKENKYVRIVKMEPRYTMGKVAYDIEEMHDPDMIEGNNQLKGIGPGYKSPDDSPDADEGAWHYLSQHLPNHNFTPIIQARTNESSW